MIIWRDVPGSATGGVFKGVLSLWVSRAVGNGAGVSVGTVVEVSILGESVVLRRRLLIGSLIVQQS